MSAWCRAFVPYGTRDTVEILDVLSRRGFAWFFSMEFEPDDPLMNVWTDDWSRAAVVSNERLMRSSDLRS